MKCNDEISIGEYVRTNSGYIGKVTEILSGAVAPRVQTELKTISTIMIAKHSKDIIDLVQKDDYVNGYKVLYVCNEEPCPSGKYVDIDCNKPSEESYFFEDEIKSIITKEQIKQIEFKIKE